MIGLAVRSIPRMPTRPNFFLRRAKKAMVFPWFSRNFRESKIQRSVYLAGSRETPSSSSARHCKSEVQFHFHLASVPYGYLNTDDREAGRFPRQNFQDRETAHPVDVWIVDQTLFHQTYESVAAAQ